MRNSENISLKKETKNTLDLVLFFSTIFLLIIGLVSLYSAIHSAAISNIFTKQIIAVSIGISIMISIFFIPNNWLKSSSVWIYILSLLLLFLVLLIGKEINGTKGWLRLGTLSIQPAEMAKIATLLITAWYISSKHININHLKSLIIVGLFFLIPEVSILFQPDIGSFSVLFFLFFAILFWSGYNSYILFIIFAIPFLFIASLLNMTLFYILASVATIGLFFFRRKVIFSILPTILFFSISYITPNIISNLKTYQKARIENFLNPDLDPLGSGYNVLQSIIAIGNGGIIGKGFLQGTQTQLKFIPMQWTDFIFSVPNEEFGFIGGSIIIILFAIIFWRGLIIAKEASSKFSSILAFGIVSIILYHCIINIGMTMGIMPVTGIPLPFLSYGGTSLIINLAMIGMLLNINKNNKLSQSKFIVQ